MKLMRYLEFRYCKFRADGYKVLEESAQDPWGRTRYMLMGERYRRRYRRLRQDYGWYDT